MPARYLFCATPQQLVPSPPALLLLKLIFLSVRILISSPSATWTVTVNQTLLCPILITILVPVRSLFYITIPFSRHRYRQPISLSLILPQILQQQAGPMATACQERCL